MSKKKKKHHTNCWRNLYDAHSMDILYSIIHIPFYIISMEKMQLLTSIKSTENVVERGNYVKNRQSEI